MDAYPPEAITLGAISTALIIAILVASVTSFILAAIEGRLKDYWPSLKKIWPALTAYSIPIVLVAYIAGILTAFSRSGAVGNVLPAVLALIGGLNIYVFGSDTKYKGLIAYCVCLFAVVLFYGTQLGAYKREIDREFRLTELARQELRIRALRKNLDLPEEFPSWIVSAEPK